MSYRSKLLSHKIAKEEEELHICTNPLSNPRLHLLNNDDYQAPLTARTLSPNSKWLIVRNNLHKIRSWRQIQRPDANDPFADWYLFFQMRNELQRFKEHIHQVENRPDFVPVHYFHLPTDERLIQRYDVSHVRPSDVLYYPSVGQEPLILQSLLYYFSVECMVPYNSALHSFFSDVCTILNRNEQRLHRAAVRRKLATILTLIVFIILGLMLFSLIISVSKTTWNFQKLYNDPNEDLEWRPLETAVNSF
jgi:predicted nucleic acid-binding Zn ribbon protein